MSYHAALDLRIIHDFWGEEPPPLRIVPSDARALARDGLIVKPGRARLDIVTETALLTDPVTVALDVIATDPTLGAVTEGYDPATLPLVTLPDDDASEYALAEHLPETAQDRAPGDPLFRLSLQLPAIGQRSVTLRCGAHSALWAYHVTGVRSTGPLQVIDPASEITFEDLGQAALPGGHMARVLRSTQPLPLRYRSTARFALEELQDPPFDPITLIPVLPAAGANLHPPAEPGASHPLQSDIYVSLW